jgi:hypothetical protein
MGGVEGAHPNGSAGEEPNAPGEKKSGQSGR